MYQTFRPLLDALVRRGADVGAIERAAEEAEGTGRSIRDVLINDSVVTELELTEASAEASGIGTVDLVDYPVDPAAVAKIPLPLVLRHRVLGIAIIDDELVVATSDPDDVVALDDVRAATGMRIRPVSRGPQRAAADHRPRQAERAHPRGPRTPASKPSDAVSNLSSAGEDAPIVRYVNSLHRAGDPEPCLGPAPRAR